MKVLNIEKVEKKINLYDFQIQEVFALYPSFVPLKKASYQKIQIKMDLNRERFYSKFNRTRGLAHILNKKTYEYWFRDKSPIN